MVFRPSGWDLPPTRSPLSLDLAQGGELKHASAGPDDRTATTPGTWSLDGDELTLRVEGRPEQRYRVESAEADRLVLRALN